SSGARSWDELEGFGHEGEHEYHEGGERGESASRVERPPVVVGGRVTEGEEDGDDGCPQEPAWESADTEPEQEGDQPRGDPRWRPARPRTPPTARTRRCRRARAGRGSGSECE